MLTALKRAWQRLTKAPPGKTQAELADRYAHFQALLAANNQVLGLMADMEEKLSGDYLFDLQYIRSAVNRLQQETGKLVEALNGLGDNRYQAVTQALERIGAHVEDVFNRRREIPAAPLVINFGDLDADLVEAVGGKITNLGKVKNRVGLPVPAGFAISTYAYKFFLDHNHLAARFAKLLGDCRLDDLDSLAQASENLKQMILAAQVPPELHQALYAAYEILAGPARPGPWLALRPSLVGEELAFTFADRYASYLNVPVAEMESCYKMILASLFPPRAVFYYKNKGFNEEDLAGGVAVMPMVQAKASGILFTRHPNGSASEAALVLAGWGISPDATPDATAMDHYRVAYQPRGHVEEKVIASKPMMWVCRPDTGLEEVPVHRDYLEAPCLRDRQLAQLLDWAEALEGHYHQAQMVEWALDWQNQLWLLNCQPLHVPHHKFPSPSSRNLKEYSVLLDQGIVAYRGVASGPVVMITKEQDLENFPQGGVLVAKHSSPSYVLVMPKAAAILTDAGSPTGHMAVLAREFQVPTILDTGTASEVLRPGQVVTVDANYGNVYDGLIPELLQPRENGNGLGDSPVFLTLKAMVKKIVPLNLINPRDEATFRPDNCRTLHDIARYAHEYAMREMFNLTEGEVRTGRKLVDLDAGLPFKVRILDLGGGLKRGWRRKIQMDQVLSLPFQAFWQGLSAMHRPQAGSEDDLAVSWPAQSSVVLSRNYMNFRIRLSHDLVTAEAYISEQVNDNYIAFGCQPDAFESTPALRERRARFVKAILDRLEFSQRQGGELIEARLTKYSPEKMARLLVILGKLTYYSRQLDQALISDDIVDWYIQDFMQEHGGN